MPGMTGIALQHKLNLCGAVIPVIFVSGHAEVSIAVEAMLQGAFNFLQKPVAHPLLSACVREALDHGRFALEPAHRRALSRARHGENRLTLTRTARTHGDGSERRASGSTAPGVTLRVFPANHVR
jgi:two-component system C4-dicarboxylate transport response regulator DctD